MTVDEIVALIAGKAVEDMHPDDVEHWRGVVYTVLTVAQCELPLPQHLPCDRAHTPDA